MIKIYENGLDFLKENDIFLKSSPFETQLFYEIAPMIKEITPDSYAFKIEENNEQLLMLKANDYPLLLSGSHKLVIEASNVILKYHLSFDKVLGRKEVVTSFLKEITNLFGGEFFIDKAINLLICSSLTSYDASKEVYYATKEDKASLYEIIKEVNKDNHGELLNDLNEHFKDYVIYRKDNKIFSFARRSKNIITSLYTLPSFRRHGYAFKVLSFLTNEIIKEQLIPSLYVNQSNTNALHLYQKIGYTLHSKLYCYQYQNPSIRSALFAGGCFWCIAMPFYSLNGVLHVISGFSSGNIINPTYEQVKSKTTGHKETIMILYDSHKIKYEDLLDIYFDSIDPFDEGGQFIDRGDNYTCAIFTSDSKERQMVKDKIRQIEDKYHRKVYVSLLDSCVFYMAEDEHQEYGLKNPHKIEHEFLISGRIDNKKSNKNE